MGFDVSYHPINEDEIQSWYFDALEDKNIINDLAIKFNIHDFYKERYQEFIQKVKGDSSAVFDLSHGFNIAVVQGFVRKYFYTRGSAFSFLLDEYPEFKEYTKPWQDILKTNFDSVINNRITENYSSGVFIPNEKVEKLLNDYKNNQNIKNILDTHYSHKRIYVFLNALEFAKEYKVGLLEATDVIIPNPLDLNNSTCSSNLFNCDVEGALLYQEAALEQLDEAIKNAEVQSGEKIELDNMKISHVVVNNEPIIKEEKLSFWQRVKNFFNK